MEDLENGVTMCRQQSVGHQGKQIHATNGRERDVQDGSPKEEIKGRRSRKKADGRGRQMLIYLATETGGRATQLVRAGDWTGAKGY